MKLKDQKASIEELIEQALNTNNIELYEELIEGSIPIYELNEEKEQ